MFTFPTVANVFSITLKGLHCSRYATRSHTFTSIVVKVATNVEFAPDHLRFLPHFIVETRVFPSSSPRVTAHAWKGGASPTCKPEDHQALKVRRFVNLLYLCTICDIHKSILRTRAAEEVFYFLGSWNSLLLLIVQNIYCLERYHW